MNYSDLKSIQGLLTSRKKDVSQERYIKNSKSFTEPKLAKTKGVRGVVERFCAELHKTRGNNGDKVSCTICFQS